MITVNGISYNRPSGMSKPHWKEEKRKLKGYYRTQSYRALRKKNGENAWANRRENMLRYYANNKEHCAARSAVCRALKNGKLIRMPCQECGEAKVQAHHHKGYEKENWLNVLWLCQEHHRLEHAKQKS